MSGDHEQHVQQQFGATAEAYLTSAVHAQGAELLELRDAVAQREGAKVLDLGCGGGHVSYLFTGGNHSKRDGGGLVTKKIDWQWD